VIEQIVIELERAIDKWGGEEADDKLQRLAWLRLIDEHRIRATRHSAGADEYRHELVVIAAVAIAGIEAHDRKRESADE
jgi:hypothetical protein